MKNTIYNKAFQGELSLPVAFWVVQFLTTAVLAFVSFCIVNPERNFIALVAPYSVYAWVCIIRCSRKYRIESKSKFKDFYSFIAVIWSSLIVLLTGLDLIRVIISVLIN